MKFSTPAIAAVATSPRAVVWRPGPDKDVASKPMDKPDMAPVGNPPSLLKVETNVMAKAVIKAAGNALAGANPINEAVGGTTTYHVAVAGAWRPHGIERANSSITVAGDNSSLTPFVAGTMAHPDVTGITPSTFSVNSRMGAKVVKLNPKAALFVPTATFDTTVNTMAHTMTLTNPTTDPVTSTLASTTALAATPAQAMPKTRASGLPGAMAPVVDNPFTNPAATFTAKAKAVSVPDPKLKAMPANTAASSMTGRKIAGKVGHVVAELAPDILPTVTPKARAKSVTCTTANGRTEVHTPSTAGLGVAPSTQPSFTAHPTTKKVAFQEISHCAQQSKSKLFVKSAFGRFGLKVQGIKPDKSKAYGAAVRDGILSRDSQPPTNIQSKHKTVQCGRGTAKATMVIFLSLFLLRGSTVSAVSVDRFRAKNVHDNVDGIEMSEFLEEQDMEAADSDESTKNVTASGTTVQDQISSLAQEICLDLSGMPEAIQEACNEDPRDDEFIVDTAVDLQDQSEAPGDRISDEFGDTCRDLEKYRSEIDAAMLGLAASSEGRHLSDSNETHITSFQLSSESLDMFSCYCDQENPSNRGCASKAMQFFEDIGSVLEHQIELDFSENNEAEFFSNMQDILQKRTSHLRKPAKSSSDNIEAASVVEPGTSFSAAVPRGRELVETRLGKCVPPPFQQDPLNAGKYKVCIYAGRLIECEFVYDTWAPTCAEFSCKGGAGLELKTTAKACALPEPAIELSLDLCVTVISDILSAIGRYLPSLEKLMNKFGIYGGCYRLGYAKYEIKYERLSISVTPGPIHIVGPFKVRGDLWTKFRFKGKDCHYTDSKEWFELDWMRVKAPKSHGIMNNDWLNKNRKFMNKAWDLTKQKNSCLWKNAGWAWIKFSFELQINFIFKVWKPFKFERQMIIADRSKLDSNCDPDTQTCCVENGSWTLPLRTPGTARTVMTPKQCQERCQQTPGCNFFNVFSNGGCYVTTGTQGVSQKCDFSGAWRMPVKESERRDYSREVRPAEKCRNLCRDISWCRVFNYFPSGGCYPSTGDGGEQERCDFSTQWWYPLYWNGHQRTGEYSAWACSERCRNTHGCRYFNYFPSKNCYLTDGSEGKKDADPRWPSLVIGSPDCQTGEYPTEMTGDPDCETGQDPTTYTGTKDCALPPGPCATDGRRALPLRWNNQERTVSTPEECKQRCKDTSGCIYFNSFWNGGCWLTDGSGGFGYTPDRWYDPTLFSGKKDCQVIY